jgi:anaerobic dimethyl sulfoxide reductase subunit A
VPLRPAFADIIADFGKKKFSTPTGKIEIFSKQLWDRKEHEEVPAVPQYVPGWEGPQSPLRNKYPLQAISWHSKRRVHSMHINNPWLKEVEQHELWINPKDAEARGIQSGERVKVFNDRGATLIAARVTPRIMPGVVAMNEGSWYNPGPDGVDQAGCMNMLTIQRPSPMSWNNPIQTNLVEVKKA